MPLPPSRRLRTAGLALGLCALVSEPALSNPMPTAATTQAPAPAPQAAPAPVQAADTLQRMDTTLSEADILKTQQGWCSALLAISRAYRSGGDRAARATASSTLDAAYGYAYGAVAFKPTLTSGKQTFRPTKAGALAYFVGGDPLYPLDKGFAIKPWTSCNVRNQVIQRHGQFAITMGNVDFLDSSGKLTTVDKTWGFLREPDGEIRIVLHHSSLPHKGP
jgi:hypothetical protein